MKTKLPIWQRVTAASIVGAGAVCHFIAAYLSFRGDDVEPFGRMGLVLMVSGAVLLLIFFLVAKSRDT